MLGAPLRIVLVDNGGGHIFDFLPQAGQLDEPTFGRLFHTPAGLDYEAVAEAFGLRYALVSEPAELSRLGAGDGGPMLLHATLDAEHNVALHGRLAEAVARRRSGGPLSPLSGRQTALSLPAAAAARRA